MNRRWLIFASTALVLALVGGGVALSEAKDGTPGAKAKLEQIESAFITKLAKRLGVSESRLREALQQAGTDTINEAVRQGLLTKEQAAFLKGRLSSGELGFDFGFGRFKHRTGKAHGLKRGHFTGLRLLLANAEARTAIANAVAKKLGTTREGLAKAFGEGKSLEELAEAKGVTEADIGAAVAAAAKRYVEALVKAGTLERTEADTLTARLAGGAWLGKLVRLSLFSR